MKRDRRSLGRSAGPLGSAAIRGEREGRDRAGFTLVETVLGMTLLLVAVGTAFHSQLTSVSLVRSADETQLATSELMAAMEEVLLIRADEIPFADDGYPAGQSIAGYDDRVLREQRITPSYPGVILGEDLPDPLTVALEMTWVDSAGRDRRMTLSTMKAR